MSFEVGEPIQNSPFEEPKRYWYIREGEHPQLIEGRRRAAVVFRHGTRSVRGIWTTGFCGHRKNTRTGSSW